VETTVVDVGPSIVVVETNVVVVGPSIVVVETSVVVLLVLLVLAGVVVVELVVVLVLLVVVVVVVVGGVQSTTTNAAAPPLNTPSLPMIRVIVTSVPSVSGELAVVTLPLLPSTSTNVTLSVPLETTTSLPGCTESLFSARVLTPQEVPTNSAGTVAAPSTVATPGAEYTTVPSGISTRPASCAPAPGIANASATPMSATSETIRRAVLADRGPPAPSYSVIMSNAPNPRTAHSCGCPIGTLVPTTLCAQLGAPRWRHTDEYLTKSEHIPPFGGVRGASAGIPVGVVNALARIRAVSGAGSPLVVLVLAAVLLAFGIVDASGAQEPPPDGPGAQLAVADASIEGSGPWTSWLGARPDRELVVTFVNIGTVPVTDPELTLRFGKGPNPTDPVDAPVLGTLAPGERVTVRVALELPRFAVGTFAVEGSLPDLTVPVSFRAETSHIPWLVLVLPLLILIQAALLRVRNRVRDRIHGPPRTSDPTLPSAVTATDAGDDADGDPTSPDPEPEPEAPPEPELEPEPDLETVIREELDRVFDDAARHFDDSLDEPAFRRYLTELATTVTERTSARIEMTPPERETLRRATVDAVLDAFDLAPTSP